MVIAKMDVNKVMQNLWMMGYRETIEGWRGKGKGTFSMLSWGGEECR